MKRRLILHLGFPRTGTTSVQGFFRRNPDALAAAGIIYPKIGAGVPGHKAFQRTAIPSSLGEETNHVALALEIHQPGGGGASLDTPLWAIAFDQIEASGAHTAIISYENFALHAENYRFDALAAKFRDFDVSGLVYLRPHEDWVVSLYEQTVRGKQRLAVPMADFPVYRGLRRFRYSAKLDTVSDHLPWAHLVVGNFDQAARRGLLEDFLNKADLPADRLLAAGEQSLRNASLPHWAILFLLRCNRAGLPDAAFAEVRRALTAYRGPGGAGLALRPGLDTATPGERATLRKATADDAGRLAERYGVTLCAGTAAPVEHRPLDEGDVEAITQAIAPRLTRPARDALNGL